MLGGSNIAAAYKEFEQIIAELQTQLRDTEETLERVRLRSWQKDQEIERLNALLASACIELHTRHEEDKS